MEEEIYRFNDQTQEIHQYDPDQRAYTYKHFPFLTTSQNVHGHKNIFSVK